MSADFLHECLRSRAVRFYAMSVFACTRQASLTYAEAQLRIDDPKMTDCVTESLRNLNKLAKIFKRRRIDNG